MSKPPGRSVGFPHCLYQYRCGHDHILPWIYQKVSLLSICIKRRCVFLERAGITIFIIIRYYQLKADTSSAQSFTLLKNFFTYVDDLEYHVFNKRIEKVVILKILL